MGKPLLIQDLHARHVGVTEARAGSYFEAACVCLARHHGSPSDFEIRDNATKQTVEITWPNVTDQQRSAWAAEIEATEHGASCCVLAGVEIARGYLAVHRAEIGVGADYYVGLPGSGVDDLEDCYRLEISGVNGGDEHEVLRRVKLKVKQAMAGKSSLPAVAGVVGFKAKLLVFTDVTP